MCQHTHIQNRTYANKSRHTYICDIHQLSNPVSANSNSLKWKRWIWCLFCFVMIYFFIGAAKIKLENKGDLTFFMKQEDIVSIRFGYFSVNNFITIPMLCLGHYWKPLVWFIHIFIFCPSKDMQYYAIDTEY